MATQQNLAPPAAGATMPEANEKGRGRDWQEAVARYQFEHDALARFEESRSPTCNVLNLGWFSRSPGFTARMRVLMHEALRERVAEVLAVPAPTPAALAKKIALGMWANGLGDPEGILSDVKGDPARQLLATVYRDAIALQKSADKGAKAKKSRKR